MKVENVIGFLKLMTFLYIYHFIFFHDTNKNFKKKNTRDYTHTNI